MTAPNWITYHFAVLRVVPHVHRGEFVNVGVVLHARTAEFMGMRAIAEQAELRRLAPSVDVEILARYLGVFQAICDGNASAGPIALLPPSERFHWIVSPRSDLIQASPVHEGICEDPVATLAELFEEMVLPRSV